MFGMLFGKICVPPVSVPRKAAGLMKAAPASLLLLTVVAGMSSSAYAGNNPKPPKNAWNGQQSGRLTGSKIFTVIGDTVTFKQGATPTYLTIAGKVTNQQVLGINAVWIVDIYGNPLSGISAGGSNVFGTAIDPITKKPFQTSWGVVSDPVGYTAGPGFGESGRPWLQLASDADLLAGSGKSPTGYTTGVFTFTGLSKLNYWEYKIGIDYLVATSSGTGDTGRAYVPAPEMSTVVSFGLVLGLGLVGMVVRRPRSRRC